MRRGDVVYYLYGDHLGSVSLVTDHAARITARQRFFPYGETRHATGVPPTDFGFTGQRNESTIGLYDYRARFYDPVLGRFISADTVVPNPGKPQDLNRYAYVRNNPLRYTDPSGHSPPMLGILWMVAKVALTVVDYGWTGYDIYQYNQVLQDENASAEAKSEALTWIIISLALEFAEPDELLGGGAPLDDVIRWKGIGSPLADDAAGLLDNLGDEAAGLGDNLADNAASVELPDVALGYSDHLFEFQYYVVPGAKAFTDWEQAGLSGPTLFNFPEAFETAMNNTPHIHFNLTGIEDVSRALELGSQGWGPYNMTHTELYLVVNNPDWFAKTTFYMNGVPLSQEEVSKLFGGP
ncbi:MAG: RHS repeat-associated core domain-containing protein [Anaerolineae bacterium]|nr:RHS repeat-associated core domain-containing protein [Anaerolineae bacterium]